MLSNFSIGIPISYNMTRIDSCPDGIADGDGDDAVTVVPSIDDDAVNSSW